MNNGYVHGFQPFEAQWSETIKPLVRFSYIVLEMPDTCFCHNAMLLFLLSVTSWFDWRCKIHVFVFVPL